VTLFATCGLLLRTPHKNRVSRNPTVLGPVGFLQDRVIPSSRLFTKRIEQIGGIMGKVVARRQNPHKHWVCYGGEGGLYCSFFCNSLVFCHFIRKTRIFCRLRPSLSSRIRLSSALQSLLWTSKVPKKSNISNKPGSPSCAYSSAALAGPVTYELSWEARNKATFATSSGRPRRPNSVFAGARRFQRIRPQSVYIKDQPSWPISVSNCIYATYALGNYLHRIR
jgi:hypothetical protein